MNAFEHPSVDNGEFTSYQLTYAIILRRQPTMYVVNLLLPSFFLMTVDLFSFVLPPQNVDRSAFKMTLILGYTVFLLLMNELLPVTGNSIPLINVFFSMCMALMVGSLLETIVITNMMCGSIRDLPMPNWLRVLFLKYFALVVCMGKANSDSTSSENPDGLGEEPSVPGNGEGQLGSRDGQALQTADPSVVELQHLGEELQAIQRHLQKKPDAVDQNAEDWKRIGLVIDRFLFWALHMGPVAPLNCSEPNTQSLLAAFKTDIFPFNAVRPVNQLTTPTNISIYFTLYAILGVDEKAQVLETFIWQAMTWRIEFLSWDPEECGTDVVTVPRNNLWRPDIVINEFVDKNKAPDTFYVRVNSSGYVTDGMPVKLKSSCNLNIYTFPFDMQKCSFTFHSYMHNNLSVSLDFGKAVEDILSQSKLLMKTMGEWELLDMTADKISLVSYESTWDELVYYVTLRRRATLYVVNLIIPSCFLITLDLFSFILPPQEVDRSAFKMTLILGYTVFLLLMNELLPVTGNTIPLLNVFFSICLALMVASLLETIIITNLMHNSQAYPAAPHWLTFIIIDVIGRLVCLRRKKTPEQGFVLPNHGSLVKMKVGDAAGGPEKETEAVTELRKLRRQLQDIRHHVFSAAEAESRGDDWILIGSIVDRFLFYLYAIFISVSFFTIVALWIHQEAV
ncbi:5-hydroxytryptamine receptor 3C-like [Engraulis encrasicolus]|uniref:5-hydroxytryptamine receptor 3C-like n=1 Tax=Engraulis encrasicolus TaxID=184585 RepID=UPI002FD60BE8